MPPLSNTPPRRSLIRWEARTGFIFILPWILGVFLLKLVPIVTALGYSFTNFEMLKPTEWKFIGLENYLTFLRDPDAGASLFASIGYFIGVVPIQMIFALLLAVLFNNPRLSGKNFLRPIFYMPTIIPATSILFVWLGLADPYSGWLNELILEPLGLPPLAQALGSSFGLFIALWSIGPSFLIMLGAMQGVSPDLYEAARVDGAGPLMRFVSITIPMISPAILFSLVINLTSAFGGAVLVDRGFPFQGSLSPMESYINYTMFTRGDLGYASALTWIMFLVVITLTIAILRWARGWVYFPQEDTQDAI